MKPFVITSILAPTDLSDSSLPALRYARLIANRFSAKVTVMFSDPLVYPFDVVGAVNGVYVDVTPEHQERMRGEVEKHAAPVMAGRPFDIHVAVGHPVPTILSAAKEQNVDLIVMGTHLRHGWRRALLGSVSDGVLHGSQCPVLTVASHDNFVGARPYAVTSILCPINFTPVAREALHVAARLAEGFGAHLTIVHVLENDEPADTTIDEQRVRSWIAPEMQDVISFRELVVRGGAAERVLDCAEDLGVDLLVVGAQHKRFREATVTGTTTDRLIRFAPSPVLVVPRGAAKSDAPRVEDRELSAAVR